MAAIIIGKAAVDRSAYFNNGYTLVNAGGAADGDGTITSIEIWAYTNISGLEVATFSASGDNLTTRDTVTGLSAAAGSKQTLDISATPLDVLTGDYLGCYFTGGTLEDGEPLDGLGIWYISSDQIPCTAQAFTASTGYTVSLYGTGATAAAGLGIPIAMHHYLGQMANN